MATSRRSKDSSMEPLKAMGIISLAMIVALGLALILGLILIDIHSARR